MGNQCAKRPSLDADPVDVSLVGTIQPTAGAGPSDLKAKQPATEPHAQNGSHVSHVTSARTAEHKLSGSVTKQGFHTDILAEKSSHVSGLVHESNMKEFLSKYDAKHGTELGRGACGTVMSVRNIHTDELFAMKTVNVADMGSWDDLQNEIETQRK